MKNLKNFEIIPCLICGKTDFKLISKKGQHDLPCYVSICKNDGLVFLNPRWTKERYMHFYIEEYDSYYRPHVLVSETEEQKYGKVKEICKRLENLNLFSGKLSVLDIGSGMGWSLDWIKKNYSGFNKFFAIEPSEICIRNLENINVSVISKDVDEAWHIANVDLIIMRHVVEHFLNPMEVLKKVSSSLSENGIVYIAVPDMMHPKSSLKHHFFRTVHTFYFSKPTLLKFTEQAGLYPISLVTSGAELWGVFRKLKKKDTIEAEANNYYAQLRVIRKHKRIFFFRDIKYAVKRRIRKLFIVKK